MPLRMPALLAHRDMSKLCTAHAPSKEPFSLGSLAHTSHSCEVLPASTHTSSQLSYPTHCLDSRLWTVSRATSGHTPQSMVREHHDIKDASLHQVR